MAYKMKGPSLYPDFLKKKQTGPVETETKSPANHKGIFAKHPSKKDGHTKGDHKRIKAMSKFPYTYVERPDNTKKEDK
jgi:hypothetical protein